SALTVRLAGIRRRIGNATEGRARLLTDVVAYDQVEFEANCMLDLSRPLGFDPQPTHPRIDLPAAEIQRGAELIGKATVGIQPGARHEWKQLKVEGLAHVARELQSRGYQIVFLGGPEEAASGHALAERLDEPVENLIGKTTIREGCGALTNLRLMIGGDTGLMHVASASG